LPGGISIYAIFSDCRSFTEGKELNRIGILVLLKANT